MQLGRTSFLKCAIYINIVAKCLVEIQCGCAVQWSMGQSGKHEVVGLMLVNSCSYKRVLPLATHFNSPRHLNWVLGIRRACMVQCSTLSMYYPQLMRLYSRGKCLKVPYSES